MEPLLILAGAGGVIAADLGQALWRRSRATRTPKPTLAAAFKESMHARMDGVRQRIDEGKKEKEHAAVIRGLQATIQALRTEIEGAHARYERLAEAMPRAGTLYAVVSVTKDGIDSVWADAIGAAGRAHQIGGQVRPYSGGFVLVNFWKVGK